MPGDEIRDATPAYGNLILEIDENLVVQFPEARRVCELYWERALTPGGELKFVHQVGEVASTVGLTSGDVSRLAKSVSRVTLRGLACPNCGRDREARNRASYHEQIKAEIRGEACEACVERSQPGRTGGRPDFGLDDLRELAARMRRAQEHEREVRVLEERKRAAVWSMSAANPIGLTPPVDELDLRHAVALLALGRACASEDFSKIDPVAASPDRFTPTRGYDFELLGELRERDLIAVDPEASALDAFVFERDPETDEIRVDQYYPFKVVWRLVEPEDPESEFTDEDPTLPPKVFRELEEVFDSSSPWPPLWAIIWEGDGWRALWKEISLQECLAYLELVLTEHGLPFRAGDKTHFVLGNVLESFSVAQVWGMIWRAGRDAAAFYMRQRSTREHAANTVVGSIQRQAERALAESWSLQSFRRDRRLPRSVLSEVFFGKALRIGDGGFTRIVPHESAELDDLPGSLEAQEN